MAHAFSLQEAECLTAQTWVREIKYEDNEKDEIIFQAGIFDPFPIRTDFSQAPLLALKNANAQENDEQE
jgi:hypothetical protein